jgi:hypothetical protein
MDLRKGLEALEHLVGQDAHDIVQHAAASAILDRFDAAKPADRTIDGYSLEVLGKVRLGFEALCGLGDPEVYRHPRGQIAEFLREDLNRLRKLISDNGRYVKGLTFTSDE